jgi:hypothetical protein
MNQLMRSKKPITTARHLQSLQRPIRSWRDVKTAVIPPLFAIDDKSLERFLRQERAVSGRAEYDINRHIRLLKSRRAILPHKNAAP